jgi:glycosyltransferase involved in cell wall biosynthesis
MNYLSLSYLKKNHIKEDIIEFPNQTLEVIPNPLVSVILITYQHIDYIEASIKGIINQNFNSDWEIIIGDDDSKDGTRDICLKYAEMYPNKIRFFQHNDRNKIKILDRPCGIFQFTYNLLQARGKYIAICSGDDIWTDSYKLEKQFNFLEAKKCCSLSYHPYREKYSKTDDDSNFGPILNNYPKASTSFYRNINKKIPKGILNVLQEDEFIYFILRREGSFLLLDLVNPTIINTPPDSIIRNMNNEEINNHILNLSENVFKSYVFSKHSWHASKNLLSTWKHLILNEKKTISF